MTIQELTSELSVSLRHPTKRTLTLLDKALAWLRPFESPAATPASTAERHALLALLNLHHHLLTPYLDTARIHSHLTLKS